MPTFWNFPWCAHGPRLQLVGAPLRCAVVGVVAGRGVVSMIGPNWTGLRISALASAAWLGAILTAAPSLGQGTLRIAMTATDVPTTTGVPNNGFEGVRFMGFTAFDALVNWN